MNLREPAAWAYALAALAWLAFAGQLAWRAARESQRGPLILAALLSVAACVSAALLAIYEDPNAWTVHRALDAARNVAWLAILARIAKPAGLAGAGRQALGLRLAVLAIAVVAVVLPLPSPYSGMSVDQQGQLALAASLGLAVIALVMVERIVRASGRDARWALKPLLVGVGAAAVFELFMLADAFLTARVDRDLWAVRGLVSAATVPLLFVGARRMAGWKLDLAISRTAVYHSTALLAAGIYLLVMAGAGYVVRAFGGDWGRVLQVALLVLGVLAFSLLMLSGSARAKLRVLVAKHFFASRFDHREEWMNVSQRLADASASALPLAVVQLLADMVDSTGGAIWLRRPGEPYRQLARWSAPEVLEPMAADAPLARFFASRGWVIDIAEARDHPDRYPELAIPEEIANVRAAWLLVPLVSGRDVLGFVLLVEPRASVEVDWELRDLLKAAARHAASHLANQAATEQLVEAGRFDAFNRMSAFVVHDIKNLVAQLSLLSRNAERHMQNPEFQADLLGTVRHVTERMNYLLAQLRAGATPVGNPAPLDLVRVVRSVLDNQIAPQPQVAVEMPERLRVLGHADRLERVVRNLIVNAQDATSSGEPVVVRAAASGDNVTLEVIDRGAGMTREFIRDRLFRPFSSTKANGMGIGAFESYQYVREIGGRIEVESEPGQGTRMVLTLPAAADATVADRSVVHAERA